LTEPVRRQPPGASRPALAASRPGPGGQYPNRARIAHAGRAGVGYDPVPRLSGAASRSARRGDLPPCRRLPPPSC